VYFIDSKVNVIALSQVCPMTRIWDLWGDRGSLSHGLMATEGKDWKGSGH
jgi:hypothetical protein